MDNQELNMNELEAVTGGKGGSPTVLPHKPGWARLPAGSTPRWIS